MTDINKQIEEARGYRRSLIRRIRLNKANIDYILENGTINGSLMLDIDKAMIDYQKYSSSWRKVSEELPEMGIQVLVRNKYGVCNVSHLLNNGWSHTFELPPLEWKPID
mgnify:FL=1